MINNGRQKLTPVIMVLLGILLVAMAKARAADAINETAIQQKIINKYDERIRRGLDSFLKNDVYLLTVKVKLRADRLQEIESNVQKAKSADADAALLPDLPINFGEKDYGKLVHETMTEAELEKFVESAEVRLVIDEGIPAATTELVSRTIRQILDPNAARQDVVNVERASLRPASARDEFAPSSLNPLRWNTSEWSLFFRHNQNLMAMTLLGFCVMMGLSILGTIVGRQIRATGSDLASKGNSKSEDSSVPEAPQGLPPANVVPAAVQPPPFPGSGNLVAGGSASSDSASIRMLVNQVSAIGREKPLHIAAVLRTYLARKDDAAKAVACVRYLPLEVSKQVVNCLSASEAAAFRAEMEDSVFTGGMRSEAAADAFRQFHTAVLAQELSKSAQDWDFLGMLTDSDLLRLIESEDLAGQALILFYLPSQRASRVYERMNAEAKSQVISEIFALEQRGYAEMKPLMTNIRQKAKQLGERPETAVADPVSWVTAVGARLSDHERSSLKASVEPALGQMDPTARYTVQAKLFSFIDAVVLPNEVFAAVLQAFKPAELGTLYASLDESSSVAVRMIEVLPTQMREIVTEEASAQRQLASQPHTRRRFNNEAQMLRNRFEQFVKNMDARGEISLVECFESVSPKQEEANETPQAFDESNSEPEDPNMSQAA